MTLLFLCFSLLFSLWESLPYSFDESISRSFEECVLFLTGANDLSEVGEQEMERFESLAAHPLQINFLRPASLAASGLFSSYQLASMEEYRRRSGDILSPLELSSVDGFSSQFVSYAAMFLDFTATGSGRDAYLSARGRPFTGEASAGFGAKALDGEGALRYMTKVKGGWGPVEASAAVRSAWNSTLSGPDEIGWSVSYSGKRILSQAVVGRFNARFGQGLLQWSGTVLSPSSTPQSLMKKPSGIAAYTSYSASSVMYGAALRFDLGQFSISPFADFGAHRYGGNVAWNHRSGQVGVTAVAKVSTATGTAVTAGATGVTGGSCLAMSADFQQTLGGVVLYGEVTTLGNALLGVRFPLWRFDTAVRALYSTDEHNVTVAASFLSNNRIHSVDLSSSVSYLPASSSSASFPGRIRCQMTYKAAPDSNWTFTTRAALTLKSAYAKYELRQDVRWSSNGSWCVSGRLHAARCKDWALLGYLEGGYIPKRLSAYLQCGLFRVDNWDDRIYVYRRDVPGSYNIPAMYGRGLWAAFYGVLKLGGGSAGVRLAGSGPSIRPSDSNPSLRSSDFRSSRPWGKLCLRLDYTAYPWAREGDRHTRPSAGVMLLFVASW